MGLCARRDLPRPIFRYDDIGISYWHLGRALRNHPLALGLLALVLVVREVGPQGVQNGRSLSYALLVMRVRGHRIAEHVQGLGGDLLEGRLLLLLCPNVHGVWELGLCLCLPGLQLLDLVEGVLDFLLDGAKRLSRLVKSSLCPSEGLQLLAKRVAPPIDTLLEVVLDLCRRPGRLLLATVLLKAVDRAAIALGLHAVELLGLLHHVEGVKLGSRLRPRGLLDRLSRLTAPFRPLLSFSWYLKSWPNWLGTCLRASFSPLLDPDGSGLSGDRFRPTSTFPTPFGVPDTGTLRHCP